MAELHTITIKGFKSIASLEKLRLGPINVVIGPNGSGKSNFLEFFRFLKAMVTWQLQDYVAKRGLQNVLHFGPKVTEALTSELLFDGGEVKSYLVTLEPGERGVLLPVSEEMTTQAGEVTKLGRQGEESVLATLNLLDFGEEPHTPATWLCRIIQSWMSCHLHDTTRFSKMRQPCPVDDNRQLRPDGSNLAAYLYFLRKKHPAAYGMIRSTVQRVAPFFDDFALAPSQFDGSRIKLEWKHRDQDQYFDAHGLSDGTLRFMALATLFLQPKELRPPLILVDEPELGLHPFAIGLLGAIIKSASVDTQVILATQSPQLVDAFSPEDILVAERDGHATTFRRLDADSLETWLEDYSLGELWEKNHIGGRPKAWVG